jgi:hypothetical protein
MKPECNISLNFGEENCSHVKLLQHMKHIIIYVLLIKSRSARLTLEPKEIIILVSAETN